MNNDLFSYIEPAVSAHPEKIAIATCGGSTLTYAELAQTVASFAGKAVELGIRRGDYVTFEVGNPVLKFCMTLALSQVGAISLTGTSVDKILAANIRLTACISLKPNSDNSVQYHRFDKSWFALPRVSEVSKHLVGFANKNDTALILTSSGTSGNVKFLPISVECFGVRLWQYEEILGEKTVTRMITPGVRTSIGFSLIMHTLSKAGTVVLPEGPVLDVLKFCKNNSVSEIYAVPAFVVGMVRELKQETISLPELKSVYVFGSAISNSALDSAEKYLCANMFIGFGASEIGIVAIAPRRELEGIAGACGFIAPWITVEAVDENNKLLPSGEVGQLRFRSESEGSIDGYLNVSQAEVDALKEGWFYPGDVGYIRKDRLMVLTGRLSNMINVGGRKLSPEEVERIAEAHDGVLQAAAAGVQSDNGYEIIGIAVTGDTSLDLEQLRKHMRIQLKSRAPIQLMTLEKFPLNQGGKFDRPKLRALFENQS